MNLLIMWMLACINPFLHAMDDGLASAKPSTILLEHPSLATLAISTDLEGFIKPIVNQVGEKKVEELEDSEGNGLLHYIAARKQVSRAILAYFIVEKQFHVCKKNKAGEDAWHHGYNIRLKNPKYSPMHMMYECFDLLYHGPSPLQWKAFCGKEKELLNALDADSGLLAVKDQRGYSLLYYCAYQPYLVGDLLKRGALNYENDHYFHLLRMLFYRAELEAKCAFKERHAKIVSSINAIIGHDKKRARVVAKFLIHKACHVDPSIVKALYEIDDTVLKYEDGEMTPIEYLEDLCEQKASQSFAWTLIDGSRKILWELNGGLAIYAEYLNREGSGSLFA